MLRRRAMTLTSNGARGWLVIAGVVAVWDVAAVVCGGESLSSSCRRALAHPAHRWKVTGAIAYLVAHFYLGAGARRFDPLCVVARGVEAGCGWVRGRWGVGARGVAPLHPAGTR